MTWISNGRIPLVRPIIEKSSVLQNSIACIMFNILNGRLLLSYSKQQVPAYRQSKVLYADTCPTPPYPHEEHVHSNEILERGHHLTEAE
jgi:hypothetical protein